MQARENTNKWDLFGSANIIFIRKKEDLYRGLVEYIKVQESENVTRMGKSLLSDLILDPYTPQT